MINHHLPEDLVRDILSRLSVKMLSRCKLVCKEWRALIQCPNFAKQHFCHESNRGRLLMQRTPPIDFGNLKGTRYLLNVDEALTKFEEPPHLMLSAGLVGPLNGVYWVLSGTWPLGPSGLLNPTTRQFKPLPLFEHEGLGSGIWNSDFGFGLGLDPVTGDFKLVLMCFLLKFAAVCTSENDYDSWRFLDYDSWGFLYGNVEPGYLRGFGCGQPNTYLNGVYYWLMDDNPPGHVLVLAFDMRTEEFKEIKVSVSCECKMRDWGLLVLNRDYLVLVMKEGDHKCIVWTMLNEDCWIASSTMVLPENYSDLRPLYFWKNDELLLQAYKAINNIQNEVLITYNLRSQKLGGPIVTVGADDCKEYCVHFNHKESLVSLKGRRENYMVWDPTTSDYLKDFFKRESDVFKSKKRKLHNMGYRL